VIETICHIARHSCAHSNIDFSGRGEGEALEATNEDHAHSADAHDACGTRVWPGSGDGSPDGCWVRCGRRQVRRQNRQVPADKALVYVIEQEKTDAQTIKIGAVTIRIGLDGQWVGANHGNTYFSLLVDPGVHSLCANWQSSIGRYSKQAAAVSLTPEAGQTYFLLTKVDERSHDNPAVWMEPLDPAEAKLLMASASLSNFHPEK
jgi:hypothetical protein